MDEKRKRTWLEIDLDAIEHNVREIRRVLPEGCRFLGVVKADAYGHGAVPVARRLERCGAAYLAVACLEEALALREAGITLPILILGATEAGDAAVMARQNITAALECEEKALAYAAALPQGLRLRVHVKLDTGMGRIGFAAGEESGWEAAARAVRLPQLEAEGCFTHFAVSDMPNGGDYTRRQYALFTRAAGEIECRSGVTFPLRHCCNSGAVLSYREYAGDMVRPGLLTYGCYPDKARGGLELRPAMSLRSRVAAVTHHKKGDAISYGGVWVAERDCTLAVLPIGYADGLHRCLSGKMEALLHGRRAPQVGRICMDVCMLDVTDIPGVQVGDVATVFGSDGEQVLPVEEVAAKAGTINYEICCAPSSRVPRVYKNAE